MSWHPLLERGGRHAELLRENKRMLDKAIRELDRERMALQNQEKKVIAEIKKTAKQGQMVRLHRPRSKHHFAILFADCVLVCRMLSKLWLSPWSGTDMRSQRCMASSHNCKQSHCAYR